MAQDNTNQEYGMRALQARLKEAAGGMSRRQIAQKAQRIAFRLWGDDAPSIDENAVRDIDTRLVNPPSDGRILRCVLSAVGVDLIEALGDLGMWPDVSLGPTSSVAHRVARAMKLAGFPNAELAGTTKGVIKIRV